MKRFVYPLLASLLYLSACTDKCTETRTYRRYINVSLTGDQVRQGIKQEGPRTLKQPGKIYTKDGYLFINELKEGIHIIDNRNPSRPETVAFLRIPGNGDMAIRNNILYADSYMDLVAFDLSDLTAIREVNRVQNVFTSGQFEGGWWSFNQNNVMLSDQRVEYVTETLQTNCEDGMVTQNWTNCPSCDVIGIAYSQSGSSVVPTANGTTGTGGSMARFTLYKDYLYAVSQSDLQLFNVSNPASPRTGDKINLGWGVETLFPYKDKLFIGSTSGMFIYDNANPAKPVRLSVFNHARVCDPVVVDGDIAYVTLRSGTTCQGFTNQLDVVDVKDLLNPTLLKSYPMQNPHGLGVAFPNLFICEGAGGLKAFDAKDALNVTQLAHVTGMDAYDVIPMNQTRSGTPIGAQTVLMIGKDGLYQFDYSNPQQLCQLSKIPVTRPY